MLNDYILKSGGPELSQSELATIQDAIHKYAAYSDHTLGDIAASVPFGELPHPMFNDEAIAETQRARDQLARAAAQVITDAKGAGLSQTAIDAIENYYGNLISEQDHFIARAKDPLLAQREALENQLASMRNQPQTRAQLIQIEALQRRLAAASAGASNNPTPNPGTIRRDR